MTGHGYEQTHREITETYENEIKDILQMQGELTNLWQHRTLNLNDSPAESLLNQSIECLNPQRCAC